MKKFMRTRSSPAPPEPPAPITTLALNGHGKLNGRANGGGGAGAGGAAAGAAGAALRLETHSTLSSSRAGGGAGSWVGPGAGAGGVLWEDPEFPADWRRVGDRRTSAADVVWMRPHEQNPRAQVLGDAGLDCEDGSGSGSGAGAGAGAGAGTNLQAEYEDRWCARAGTAAGGTVAAAVGALATCPRLLARVLRLSSEPRHASHTPHTAYTGTYSFMLWEWGTWRSVHVDDRLPTRRGVLLSSHSRCSDYTVPLLEKACAKFYGSYGALRAGSLARVLQDLTGGVVQSFPLEGPGGSGKGTAGGTGGLAFHVLNSAVPRSTLLVAYIETEADGCWRVLPCGLVSGQAYSVTGLARAAGVPLVRLRGSGATGGAGAAGEGARGAVWCGPWARGSAEWRALSDRDRDLLAERTRHHDEFWMSFSEFVRVFSGVVLVHVPPDDWALEPALRSRRPWRAVLARRRWTPGHNAGGDPDHPETTSTNPQFQLSVPEDGEGAKCHVVVAVCQQYRAGGGAGESGRGRAGKGLLEVGFAVYAVPAAAPRNTPLQLNELRALDVTHAGRAREVATFFTLPPGRYVLAPHARPPHRRAAFLLRVLTDTHTALWEVNEDNVVVRDVPAEFLDSPLPVEIKPHFTKFFKTQDNLEEMDAEALYRALRSGWCWGGGGGGGRDTEGGETRALARALLALAERGAGRGLLAPHMLPRLLHLLHYWKHIYEKYGGGGRGSRSWCGGGGGGGASCYRLRALLWAAGLTCSNKVLEALALRYGRGRHRTCLALPDLALALCELHIAHERYRSLEARVKSNPLSLEEMILMTIYS